MKSYIFIHGLEGSSRGVKASLLQKQFPRILVPDFRGSLDERMRKLIAILGHSSDWIIIGSSFGGLMGALFACRYPERVQKLILFAPALVWPDFAGQKISRVDVPTIIYHGTHDEVIPIKYVRRLAENVFNNLTFIDVDDDHGLFKTVHGINWKTLLLD